MNKIKVVRITKTSNIIDEIYYTTEEYNNLCPEYTKRSSVNMSLLPNISLLENIALPLIFQNTSLQSSFYQSKIMLQHFDLREYSYFTPAQVSSNVNRIAKIARSIITIPQHVVIVDSELILKKLLLDKISNYIFMNSNYDYITITILPC